MIKAVLFDADGVLLDGKMFSQQYFEDFGYKIPDEFFETEFEDALIGKKDLKEVLEPKLEEWGWSQDVFALIAYWINITPKINTELIDIVKQLKMKGFKCFVVTNQEKYRADQLIKVLGFGLLFDGFFASSSVGYKKPQIEFFQHVLSEINCQGDEVLYFDDSPGYLIGARSLNIQAFLYKDLDETKKIINEYKLL